jgi:hypothetical protein
LYDIHQKKVAECDKRIETVLKQLKATRPTPAKPLRLIPLTQACLDVVC